MKFFIVGFAQVIASRRYLPVPCYQFLRNRCQQLFRQAVEFGGDAHGRSGWEKTKAKGCGRWVDLSRDEISLLSDVVVLAQHFQSTFH